ncbi:hypothetical protein ACFE04_016866 [Oxalis oulophora]
MSFIKDVIDSLSSKLFTYDQNPNSSTTSSSSSSSSSSSMESSNSITNERTAYKLKGYFDLATEEIDKAVRAEEWGLNDDAILHYKNAQRIFIEASSTPTPSFISTIEKEKVKNYRQKISKWQGQVSDRLQALSRRTGGTASGTSAIKNTLSRRQSGVASTSTSSFNKDILQQSPRSTRSNAVVRNTMDRAVSPKPVQESGNGLDSKLVEMINTAIVDRSPSVKWEDVGGLEKAKQTLMEMVILPTKRRDLFTGLRRPARGLLLFGPPGNGKTMLAKAVASESEATFFNVSASSLTSKWIDSVLSSRVANENDASRRLKSEFLIQFDGVTSNSNDLVIVIGATNKPQELDDAVLRRLVKKIYIPLPDESVRRLLLKTKLKGQSFFLPGKSKDIERLARETEGYSGSDLQALCEEAAMMPIRELGTNILTVRANQVRPLKYEDFQSAMKVIRPSLNKSKWEELEQWNQEFGAN